MINHPGQVVTFGEAIKNRDKVWVDLDCGLISWETYSKAGTKVMHLVIEAQSLSTENPREANKPNNRLVWKVFNVKVPTEQTAERSS